MGEKKKCPHVHAAQAAHAHAHASTLLYFCYCSTNLPPAMPLCRQLSQAMPYYKSSMRDRAVSSPVRSPKSSISSSIRRNSSFGGREIGNRLPRGLTKDTMLSFLFPLSFFSILLYSSPRNKATKQTCRAAVADLRNSRPT